MTTSGTGRMLAGCRQPGPELVPGAAAVVRSPQPGHAEASHGVRSSRVDGGNRFRRKVRRADMRPGATTVGRAVEDRACAAAAQIELAGEPCNVVAARCRVAQSAAREPQHSPVRTSVLAERKLTALDALNDPEAGGERNLVAPVGKERCSEAMPRP